MADTKTSGLTALTGASLAAADLVAVVDVSDTTLAATGTDKRMTVTELVAGLGANGVATDAELTAHEADTTSVHGIADTSVLATASTLATAVSNHAAAVDPHADRAYADTVGNLKLAKASNLSDLANAATARTNLGLAAIAASGSASDLSDGTVPSARLGTGGAGAGAKVLADNQTFVDRTSGDVVGPAVAVDNALARFDSTTGKLVQNSTVFASDAAVLGLGSLSSSHAGIKSGQDKNGFLAVRAVRADDGLTVSLVGYSLQLGSVDPSANTDHTIFYDAARSEFTLGSGVLFGWGPNAANPFADADLSFTRNAAGEASVNAGRTNNGSGKMVLAGLRTAVVTKSADYTATASDQVILVDATGGAVTITLPAIAAANRGKEYRVKKIDSSGNAVTIARSGSDTIDGATTSTLATQYLSRDFVAPDSGVDWAAF